jgi:hypothetical protein
MPQINKKEPLIRPICSRKWVMKRYGNSVSVTCELIGKLVNFVRVLIVVFGFSRLVENSYVRQHVPTGFLRR